MSTPMTPCSQPKGIRPLRWCLNIISVLYLLIQCMYDKPFVLTTPRPNNMMKYIVTEIKPQCAYTFYVDINHQYWKALILIIMCAKRYGRSRLV